MSRSGELVEEESRNNSNGRVLVETRSGEVGSWHGWRLCQCLPWHLLCRTSYWRTSLSSAQAATTWASQCAPGA